MRWRPRYSLRTLLILVTLVSLGCHLFSRHREFSRRPEKHEVSVINLEQGLRYVVGAGWNSSGRDLQQLRREEEEKEAARRSKAEVHRQLGEKYRRAAKYPWLPVANDPPGVRFHFCCLIEIENGKAKWVSSPLFADEPFPELAENFASP